MKRVWLSVVFTMCGVALCGAQVKPTRLIVLDLTMPGGAHPQLTIAEGATGSVYLASGQTPANVSVIPGPTGGPSFGLKPVVRDAAGGTVAVDVLDIRSSPYRMLATVVGTVGGAAVPSRATPRIDIRVARIITK